MRLRCLSSILLLGGALAACGGRTPYDLSNINNQNRVSNNNNAAGRDARVPDAYVRPDGFVWPDAFVWPDGRPPWPDGAVPCTEDRHLLIVPGVLSNVYSADPLPITEGQTVRLHAMVDPAYCQRLAYVRAQMDPAAMVINLYVILWQEMGQDAECQPTGGTETDLVPLSNLSPGTWTVRDGLNPNGPTMTLTVGVCDGNADCFCQSTPPGGGGQGDPCQYNCQCQSTLRCLRYHGFGGPLSECGRSCTRDVDCDPDEWCMYALDGPYGICYENNNHQCPSDGCPDGFVCTVNPNGSSYCQATFTIGPMDPSVPCNCDDECTPGLRCVDWGGSQQPMCAAPCHGNRECPNTSGCGAQDFGGEPVCYGLWL